MTILFILFIWYPYPMKQRKPLFCSLGQKKMRFYNAHDILCMHPLSVVTGDSICSTNWSGAPPFYPRNGNVICSAPLIQPTTHHTKNTFSPSLKKYNPITFSKFLDPGSPAPTDGRYKWRIYWWFSDRNNVFSPWHEPVENWFDIRKKMILLYGKLRAKPQLHIFPPYVYAPRQRASSFRISDSIRSRL